MTWARVKRRHTMEGVVFDLFVNPLGGEPRLAGTFDTVANACAWVRGPHTMTVTRYRNIPEPVPRGTPPCPTCGQPRIARLS